MKLDAQDHATQGQPTAIQARNCLNIEPICPTLPQIGAVEYTASLKIYLQQRLYRYCQMAKQLISEFPHGIIRKSNSNFYQPTPAKFLMPSLAGAKMMALDVTTIKCL